MNRKIKARLVVLGIKQKDIAEELGVLLSTVSGVIGGHHSSARIRDYITKRLGKGSHRLWDKAS